MPNRRSSVRRGRGRSGIALLGAGLIALSAPSFASAWCQLTTDKTSDGACSNSGRPLAWKEPCISYAVAERVLIDPKTQEVLGPNENPPFTRVLAMIDASFNTWTSVPCDSRSLGFTIRQLKQRSKCTKTQQNETGPNVNSIAFVWDWEERDYSNDVFAFTAVWHSPQTGEILGVDMEVNETLGTWGDCCPTGTCPSNRDTMLSCYSKGVIDIQNVITHEAGHFFGLDDEPTAKKSAMDPTSVMGDISKRFLTDDDREGICGIYPQGSLFRECDDTPPGGLSLACYYPKTTAACECVAVGRSPDGAAGPAAIAGLIGLTALWARRRKKVPPSPAGPKG
jgi:MYXO-CTERM domain-containing protein